MNGELAQVATIVSHGNRWLRSGGAEPFDWQALSSFQYAHAVRFAYGKRRLAVLRNSTVVAETPLEWLSSVARQNGSRLSMVISTDLKWLIRVHDVPIQMWRPQLKRSRARDDGKPWDQWYVAGYDERVSIRPPKDVAAASTALAAALDSIISFARQADLEDWAIRFGAARSILDQEDAAIPYYPDLVAGRTHDVRRLAAASATASAFNGAGSWNDMTAGIRRIEGYQEATSNAYSAVLDGVAAAANASP
jgi:hypothetical protein